MRVDRVAEDIFILFSERYAQVTSTVILSEEGAVVVDTMPFPNETRQIIEFVEDRLGPDSVRYVINTHYHADHVYGTCLFEHAQVISQALCRQVMYQHGRARLTQAKRETPELAELEIRLPDMTFDEEMCLHVGHHTLQIFRLPGHTRDGLGIHVPEEKTVIAGDTVMPVPHIVNGDVDEMIHSLKRIRQLEPDFVVQGHGDVLLRGEIEETIDSSINYLKILTKRVAEIVTSGAPPSRLREIDIEDCGKSRIPLDGLVTKLHTENVITLYKKMINAS